MFAYEDIISEPCQQFSNDRLLDHSFPLLCNHTKIANIDDKISFFF